MEEVLHIAEHVLEHSLSDTLYLIPFLFATYVLMEWLEHKTGARTQNAIRKAGAAGPAVGALLGVVPQCGFSAVSAALWAGRVITLGTLFAVFLSTSDEMLPIFLAEQVPLTTILSIMGTKVAIGMIFGFLIDAGVQIWRRSRAQKTTEDVASDSQHGEHSERDASPQLSELRIHEICAQANCGCTHDCATCTENPAAVYEHHDDCQPGCSHEGHQHDHSHDDQAWHGWKAILKSATIHTVKTTLFIFVITILLNTVLETVGEDALAAFIEDNPNFSVFASALVGLVPNCAASVVIAQLYVSGVLGAGAMLSGLLVSAGVGFIVLFDTNRHLRQNLAIIAGIYAIGIVCGLIVNALGLIF